MIRFSRQRLQPFFSFALFFFLFLVFPQMACATTILLDPGHSYPSHQGDVDPTTKLHVGDNDGAPGERKAMQETAELVRDKLKADGYNVVLTKNSVDGDDDLDLIKRAVKANTAKADLAVSLHYDDLHEFGKWGQVYTQKVGLSRYNGTSGNKLNEKKFELQPIADKSKGYATPFLDERGKAEGHTPDNTNANFDGRGTDFSKGNIPMVMLFATVPWIYNEAGGKKFNKEKYAEGIYNAIKKAVPSDGSGAGGSGDASSSCVITKVGDPKASPPPLPPECGSSGVGGGPIIEWAQKIADKLKKGNNGNFSVLKDNVCNGSNCAHQKPGPSTGSCYSDPNGVQNCYWCTWIVIDSYTLAGVKIPQNLMAVGLYDDMKKLPGFVGYDYNGGGSSYIESIRKVKPGYAIGFEGHIGLVKSISVNERGDGTITTLESNSGSTSHTWPISGGTIKKGGGHAIRGLAGQK